MTRRPHVVVYITREHPETGADEFLVFDVPDQPEYAAVVPGGGIDGDETVEAAAGREAREETGVDVEVVRLLGTAEHPGIRNPDFVHVSHFVQARAGGPLPETWEHRITGVGEESGALVVCRWLPVRGDSEVWGYRGAFLHALVPSGGATI